MKTITKEYKDYYMFITIHHSLIEVSVHSYTDDNFKYTDKFILHSAEEVFETICYRIDNNLLKVA
jgi:hypothetical protein